MELLGELRVTLSVMVEVVRSQELGRRFSIELRDGTGS